MNKIKNIFTGKKFKHGSFSVGLCVVVIAIVVVDIARRRNNGLYSLQPMLITLSYLLFSMLLSYALCQIPFLTSIPCFLRL